MTSITSLIQQTIDILFPCIIFLLLYFMAMKHPKNERVAFKITKWVLIAGGLILFLSFGLMEIIFPETIFRAGPYHLYYFFVLPASMLIPLTLLYKPIGSKAFFQLLTAFFLNFNTYFEKYVIIITSLHRDFYSPFRDVEIYSDAGIGILSWLVKGLILAVILIVSSSFLNTKKPTP